MDTVYSNKKYLQSLTAGSDFYRSATVRPMANEYSSYQNTMGRRSTLGPAYTHMSKYSYPTDVSMSSHYGGYNNTWGLWRDTRNISPSGFSTIKQQKSLKSFSIILLTAAFIVVLAVVSIAGLAFYFSTFKAEIDESILVFDGSFRVAKGDVYTTGLRYNQTSAFRQKAQFYEKLIKTAFESHDLVVTKCDILHFGDGPLIHVNFRVFLDMREIPVTLNNVEQHITTALIDEISSSKSYKTIKIDLDTIEIKRLLDEDVLRSASFIHDIPSEEHDNFVTQETRNLSLLNDKDKNIRKTGVIEKTPSRFQSISKDKNKNPGINESEIDMENLPVIQGSFEVTKTDADITQRKLNSTTHAAVTTSTLKPFIVSPAMIKIKENGVSSPTTKSNTGMVEKVTTRTYQYTKNTLKTTVPTTTTTPTPEPITTTEKIVPTTRSPTTTTAVPINDLIMSTPQQQDETVDNSELQANVQNPPKLDVNLFTSAPILDNEPWRPIAPTIIQPMKNQINYTENEKPLSIPSPMEILKNPFIEKDVQLRNNFNKYSEQITASPNQSSIYYKSFTNPGFSTSSQGIERLGAADVKPYPIPVNKIIMDDVPDFKYVDDDKKEVLLDEAEEKNKFDYIGGGVLVKKNHSEMSSTEKITSTSHSIYYTSPNITDVKDTLEIIDDGTKGELATQFSTDLGELLLDLLEIHDDKSRTPNYTKTHMDHAKNPFSPLFSRTETTTTTEVPETTVLNMVSNEEVIQPEYKNKETEIEAEIEELSDDYDVEHQTSSYVEVETLKNTSPKIYSSAETTSVKPTTLGGLYQDSLFPLHSKWEFVNGTLITPKDAMKKVFNSTLQALVVENEEPMSPEKGDKNKNLQRKNTDKIQNISAIFDDLASKLGIQPEISSKFPPYAILPQNKFKTNNRLQSKFSVRDKIPEAVVPNPPQPSSSPEHPSTSQEVIPILLTDESSQENTPIVEGQAEIEEIDPQIYEEILKSESTSTPPTTTTTESLVTLLPVKSNSGLRIFKRPGQKNEKRDFGSNFREAVVRTSVHANEYSSYQNTMGRRSTLGPAYTHMSKYSYPTDVSMSSHYGGYNNTWGLWRDTRNISPSGFSTIKQQKSLKSFSIILLTAAFIVVLAVVSIAGLAFYFSTFKAEIDESILVFDGSFRVAKGDVYTTGLRYNQTSAFRQKAQFYEKLIKTAFESHDLVVTKCDILHFGDGPLIHVNFRVFLDMREIPVTLNNVEQHITTALIDEISSSKSYKTIKIDLDTIEIKRLLDEDVLRSASFIHDIPSEEHDNFVTQETRNLSLLNDKDKNIRKTGVIEKTPSRFQSISKDKNKNPGINESEIDMENLPVIQGSFEVTKTDADITQRKLNSTTHAAVTTSTLKPFIVSPAMIKIKENGVSSPTTKSNTGMVEKVTTRTYQYTKNTLKTTVPTTTTTPTPEPITTTEKIVPTTRSPTTTTAVPINDLIMSTPQQQDETVDNSELQANVQNPPKLDVNLFTSAPILDNEPWRPIAPTIIQPMKNQINYTENEKPLSIPSPMEILKNPFIEKDVQLRNNFNKYSEQITASPNQSSIYYKSFTNPGFSTSSQGIERLGAADVKPYPIPVNKIIMDDVPDFKYVDDDKKEVLLDEAEEKNKFDYIGGGVLVKKNHSEMSSTEKITSTSHSIYYTSPNITDVKDTLEIIDDGTKGELATQFSTDLGELLLDLLEIHDDKSRTPNYTKTHMDHAKNPFSPLFSRTETTTTTEVPETTVLNMVSNEEVIQPEYKNKETEIEAEIEELSDDYDVEHQTSSYVEVETLKNTSPKIYSSAETTSVKPTTLGGLYQDSLFPLHSKWEFVNGTLITPKDAMKKVFNSTLQALVVENEEPMSPEKGDKNKNLQRKNTDKIQNISAIFDDLASKLGIQPEISSKFPPYAILPQNKFKTNNRLQSKFSVRDKIPEAVVPNPPQPSSSPEHPSTSQEVIPILLTDESSQENTPIVEGQAEIEEIDPQIYEEILKSESTSTPPTTTTTESLVTLLPVKSNSGLRIFKRPGQKNEKRDFGSNFREAVVRTSVHVRS